MPNRTSNIGLLHLLKDLYGEVIITTEVYSEFGGGLPDWIVVIQVKDKLKQVEIENRQDKGEASTIALALEVPNAILIIDEVKGRNIAKSLNIEIIGTIGVLIIAGNKGLVKDVLSVILKLVNQGFRLSDKMIEKIIEKFGRKYLSAKQVDCPATYRETEVEEAKYFFCFSLCLFFVY